MDKYKKRVEEIGAKNFYKAFPITSVCRGDLEQAGFDTKNVDDDIMTELASKMADVYCDMGFWEELDVITKDLGIKRRKESYQLHLRDEEY